MRASFVVPSWHYWADPLKLQPMWEMYYATVLNVAGQGLDVDIIDLRGQSKGKDLRSLVETIPERDVFFFWIMKSGDAVEVEGIAALLKQRFPACRVIAGGTHVDMCTDRSIERFDAVVTGPGETALIAAARNSTRDSGALFVGNYGEDRFDSTPFPDRGLLPRDRVVNTSLFAQYGGEAATSMYMSRGCVYSCAFCVYNVPNELQVRSTQMLQHELMYLKENYGIRAINLRDEVAIHPNRKIAEACLNELKDADVIWRGQTTTLAKREQLELAADSGCVELSVGVETVDDQVMRIINKKWQTSAGIRRFFSDARDLGIKVKVCLILGLPGEPENIVEKTIEFLEEVDPDFASVSGFCPVPGSPIARNPEAFGIEYIDDDLSKHAHLLYRFADDEEVGLPFRYAKVGPWGPTFTREQIASNIMDVQRWLGERGKTY